MNVKAFYHFIPQLVRHDEEIFRRLGLKSACLACYRMDKSERSRMQREVAHPIKKSAEEFPPRTGHVGQSFVTSSISRIAKHGMSGVFQMRANLMRATRT